MTAQRPLVEATALPPGPLRLLTISSLFIHPFPLCPSTLASFLPSPQVLLFLSIYFLLPSSLSPASRATTCKTHISSPLFQIRYLPPSLYTCLAYLLTAYVVKHCIYRGLGCGGSPQSWALGRAAPQIFIPAV